MCEHIHLWVHLYVGGSILKRGAIFQNFQKFNDICVKVFRQLIAKRRSSDKSRGYLARLSLASRLSDNPPFWILTLFFQFVFSFSSFLSRLLSKFLHTHWLKWLLSCPGHLWQKMGIVVMLLVWILIFLTDTFCLNFDLTLTFSVFKFFYSEVYDIFVLARLNFDI